MADNIFGHIVTGHQVEKAVVDFLSKPDPVNEGTFISTYLGEVERLEGYQPMQIQRPRYVVTASEFATMADDVTPLVVVVCNGFASAPERQGDGSYRATWDVQIAGVVGDTDVAATRLLAQVYATAIRTAVMQHRALGGICDGGAMLVDEGYDDLPFTSSRTLAAGKVSFHVPVRNILTEYLGPATPLPDPQTDPGPYPTITQIIVDTVSVPVDEEVNP